ncbi:MAG: carboxypeptidase regulatory-like domain-containing protein [Planctomycetes bacterium]|nr:carboxypeptidase regulatory-like domain-containing protein [Planctomycetota bacterium]
MTTRHDIRLPVWIAAGAIAAGLWFSLAGRDGPNVPPAQDAPAPAADGPAEPAAAGPIQAGEPVRESALLPPDLPAGERLAVFAQGLRGVAVDGRGAPLPEVRVYLLESPRNEPLALPARLQQGLATGPLAEVVTGPDGTFAVGLHVPTDKYYELRLLSPRHADQRVGDLRILPGEWHDVGAVTLVPGATLRGRVTIEGTTTPVPRAVVEVDAGTVFEDAAMRALPGRERGLVAAVDQDGVYELRNAPARGAVRISAVAPGFARVVRANVELAPGPPQVVDFGLPPGLSIAGTVVDGAGRPVPRARVEAWPQDSASAPSVAPTQVDGRFDLLGLVTGRHRVRVLARGYQDQELADVAAGRDDLQFRLVSRATIAVRALAPDLRVVRRYQLAIRRWFRNDADPFDSHVGLVAEVPDQRVRLDGMTDAIDVAGLPVGSFVAEVTAEGFARCRSSPFDVAPDTRSLSVDVQLHRGASLRGQVIGEDGAPLAGATVETQPDGAAPDNPVWRMLAQSAPERVTRRSATTAGDGTFVLPHLALASYQLQVDHPEACRVYVRGLRLEALGERSLPPVRLPRGAAVTGRATAGGRIPGQMKILLQTRVEPGAGRGAALEALRLETVTDAQGRFRMDRRVPPGTYELRAAVVGTAEPDAQIFSQLLQLRRSSTTFTVVQGQRLVEQTIDLPTDH